MKPLASTLNTLHTQLTLTLYPITSQKLNGGLLILTSVADNNYKNTTMPSLGRIFLVLQPLVDARIINDTIEHFQNKYICNA